MNKESYKQSRLTMFAYIIDEQKISYNKYMDLYGIKRRNYKNTKIIRTDQKIYQSMLKSVNDIMQELKLNIKPFYIKEDNKTTWYYVKGNNQIYFDIKHLKKEIIKYQYEIIYLYLITNKYLTLAVINKLFGQTSKERFAVIRKEIQSVISGTIYYNKKYNTYSLKNI